MPRGRAKLPGDRHRGRSPNGFAPARCGRRRLTRRAAPVAVARARHHRRAARVLVVPADSQAPRCPSVRDAAWPRTDIDRFVLARLEREGLAPVGPADKLTLLRRATLDLTGLPPTPEEVDAFLADASPDAFEKVIDRLLASPRYGEAWGRMWLDVARYGEDDYRSLDPMGRGFNPYPNAHLYRDWVIRAFNDDLPYDQFVTAQLAGDLLDGPERAAPPAGARLPRPRPLVLRQRRRRDHARRRAPRSRRRRQPRLARPDRRLRPLPRSQVRPDSDEGLLRARRRVPERRVSRISAGAEGGRRGLQGEGEAAQAEARDARRVHQRRGAAAGRDAGVPGGALHEGRVAGDRRAAGRTSSRSSTRRSSTTSCSTAGWCSSPSAPCSIRS